MFSRENSRLLKHRLIVMQSSMRNPGICVILSCISEKNFVEENTEAEIIDEEREIR